MGWQQGENDREGVGQDRPGGGECTVTKKTDTETGTREIESIRRIIGRRRDWEMAMLIRTATSQGTHLQGAVSDRGLECPS